MGAIQVRLGAICALTVDGDHNSVTYRHSMQDYIKAYTAKIHHYSAHYSSTSWLSDGQIRNDPNALR
jgi:hypothetical protein